MVSGADLLHLRYGQFEPGLAAFATEAPAGSPPGIVLGVALAANTLVIVVAQLASSGGS
ncbi:hypothetical protein ACU686_21345 [Yinghuangia aomiensis]